MQVSSPRFCDGVRQAKRFIRKPSWINNWKGRNEGGQIEQREKLSQNKVLAKASCIPAGEGGIVQLGGPFKVIWGEARRMGLYIPTKGLIGCLHNLGQGGSLQLSQSPYETSGWTEGFLWAALPQQSVIFFLASWLLSPQFPSRLPGPMLPWPYPCQ